MAMHFDGKFEITANVLGSWIASSERTFLLIWMLHCSSYIVLSLGVALAMVLAYLHHAIHESGVPDVVRLCCKVDPLDPQLLEGGQHAVSACLEPCKVQQTFLMSLFLSLLPM